MKKLLTRLGYAGGIVALFLVGSYLDVDVELKRAWAQVQSNVGAFSFVPTGAVGGPRWQRNCATISPTADNQAQTLYSGTDECTVLDVDSINRVFNPATSVFNRSRDANTADSSNADGLAVGVPYLYNQGGNNFVRPRTATEDGLTSGLFASGNMIFDGATWSRMRNIADGANATGLAASMIGLARGDTGAAGFDRHRTATVANMTATTSRGVAINDRATTWSVTSSPAAATQATASKAAGGGTVRHVPTMVTACFTTQATATGSTGTVHLRDGATGAGTIVSTWRLHAWRIEGSTGANETGQCITTPVHLPPGSANTAMTLEFSAAGAANTFQTVTLSGYSLPD